MIAAGLLLAAALAPARTAGAQSPPEETVLLAAVGDIRLDGPVGELIALEPDLPWRGIAGSLKADILFGNLECSITKRGTKQAKTWNFRAPPGRLISLKKAKFDVLNLANNHVWDFGEEGFRDTLGALRARRLGFVGAGKNLEEARALMVVRAGDLRVGFLGFTSTFPKEAWASRRKPGVAYSDFDAAGAVVRRARKDCDVLVVSLHGGTELAEEPNDIQKGFSRLAVDSGADLILGHHPHVLQGVELYRDKPILHSLGNFMFVSPSPQTRVTVVARIRLARSGVKSIEFVPVDIGGGRLSPAGSALRDAAFAALDRFGVLTARPERFRLAPP